MARILSADDVYSEVMEAPLDLVPLFAYGTLRPGEALDSILDVEKAHPGTVYGYALYDYGFPNGYPWMVAERGQTVRGDLLWVHRNLRFRNTAQMEMRAGYRAGIVPVYTDLMDEPVHALAFIYPGIPMGTSRIESGDWKDRPVLNWGPEMIG